MFTGPSLTLIRSLSHSVRFRLPVHLFKHRFSRIFLRLFVSAHCRLIRVRFYLLTVTDRTFGVIVYTCQCCVFVYVCKRLILDHNSFDDKS